MPVKIRFLKKKNEKKKRLRIIETNETKDDRNSHCKISKFWVTGIVKTSQKQISVADKGFSKIVKKNVI
jgi:hypothetical protein